VDTLGNSNCDPVVSVKCLACDHGLIHRQIQHPLLNDPKYQIWVASVCTHCHGTGRVLPLPGMDGKMAAANEAVIAR